MLKELKEKLTATNIDMLPPDGSDLPQYNYNLDPLSNIPGISFLGRTPYKKSCNIKKSPLSIGFETLDRDTFDPKKTFPFLANSGVKHARCQTGWMKTEKHPGIYNFEWLDEVVDGLADIGIQAWFNLGYGNQLYTPCEKYEEAWRKANGKLVPGWARGYVGEVPIYHGEEAMAAWHRYVCAISEHFKGRVTHWEVWNEPEGFWHCNGECMVPKLGIKQAAHDYFEFVKFTAGAIRSVIADAKIIAVVAQTGTTYIRELGKCGIGEIIDVFAYHSYDTAVPENLMEERIRHIKANIIPEGKNIEIWQGESGRASGKSSLFGLSTEYNQAKYLVRRYVIDILCGATLSSFFTVTDFLCYYDDGRDQYFGVIDAKENRPKLAFYALQGLGWLFDGLELAPDLFVAFTPHSYSWFGSILPYNVKTGCFRRKGIPVFCLWLPEHVDISTHFVDGVLRIVTDEDTPLKDPVIIDPIRRNVWQITVKNGPKEYFGFFGSLNISPFHVTDYPLFITDASIFNDFLL